MNINQHQEELIIGYLENRLSDEQLKEFFSWIEENEENASYFFDIKTIYQSQNKNKDLININESWIRMQMKLNEKINAQKKRHTPLFRRLYPYAAAFLALCLITSVYFMFFKSKEDSILHTYKFNNSIGLSSLYLPDGTEVRLASNSTLEYQSDFGKKNRTVVLDGEAYFEVSADKTKPFVVESGEQHIKVLGTKFNVQAYKSDSLYTATLLEGSIIMASREDEYLLKPGQQILFNKLNETAKISDTDTDLAISWLSGYYKFNRQPLTQILNRMSKVYGVDFIPESEDLNKMVFSGTFYQGQDLEDFMKVIRIGTGLEYKISDKKIWLYKNTKKVRN